MSDIILFEYTNRVKLKHLGQKIIIKFSFSSLWELSLSPLCELFFPPLCELFLPQRPAVDFTLTTMDSDFTEKLQQIKLTEEEVDLLMVQATQREKKLWKNAPLAYWGDSSQPEITTSEQQRPYYGLHGSWATTYGSLTSAKDFSNSSSHWKANWNRY